VAQCAYTLTLAGNGSRNGLSTAIRCPWWRFLRLNRELWPMRLAVCHRLWNRCAEMPFVAQNPPIGPPIRLYRPLECAYHARLPFVPRSCADRPLVGQNPPLVSLIPQNRPPVGFTSDPSCLKKILEKNSGKCFRLFPAGRWKIRPGIFFGSEKIFFYSV
jgi:hypothetical protein